MGTLDPMASGVLPVAVGNAARLFDYFLDKKKTYVATFIFGTDSDTLDITGNLVENVGYVPTDTQIKEALSSFTGEILQVPPKYSAKNINGKRGYQLARAGVEFELPPKKVRIYSFKLLSQGVRDSFTFEIECGGGTYIRSLARDLGKKLGTCAVMSGLRRTVSGIFYAEKSVKTDILNTENILNYVIPTDSVLPYESIVPTLNEAKKLFNGLTVGTDRNDGIYKIYRPDGSFYGLAEAVGSVLKVTKKLC